MRSQRRNERPPSRRLTLDAIQREFLELATLVEHFAQPRLAQLGPAHLSHREPPQLARARSNLAEESVVDEDGPRQLKLLQGGEGRKRCGQLARAALREIGEGEGSESDG